MINNDKLIFRIVLGVSIFVFIAVVILNEKILPKPSVLPSWTYTLPLLNAFINGTCAVLLSFSLYFIKKGNVNNHKRINFITFILSSLFLVSYITYHWISGDTVFPKENSWRPIYLSILVSHIILAAVVLPMILMSFYYGMQNNIIKHRKLAKFTWPIWFYVCVTGVVIYYMISPYYPAH